jgi:hypothetical protein
VGTIETGKSAEIVEKCPGKIGSILPTHTFLKRTLAYAEDDCEEFSLRKSVGPFGKKPLTRRSSLGNS